LPYQQIGGKMRLKTRYLLQAWLVAGILLISACGLLPPQEIELVPTIALPVDATRTPSAKEDTPTPTATEAIPSGKITPTHPKFSTPVPLPEEKLQPQQAAPKPFQLHTGSPSYIPAFMHQEDGCSWVGIAGQVIHYNGTGMANLAVLVTGTLDGQQISRAVLTSADSSYGPGGYEIFIANRIGKPGENVLVQLFSIDNQPLSDPLVIAVPDQCDQNLALVNFKFLPFETMIFLPKINHGQ
jgi:hypothetical protein